MSYERTDGQIDRQTNRWMDGWTDRPIQIHRTLSQGGGPEYQTVPIILTNRSSIFKKLRQQ